jgi:hypothetical protein
MAESWQRAAGSRFLREGAIFSYLLSSDFYVPASGFWLLLL